MNRRTTPLYLVRPPSRPYAPQEGIVRFLFGWVSCSFCSVFVRVKIEQKTLCLLFASNIRKNQGNREN